VFTPWSARGNGTYAWVYEPFQYFALDARYSLDLAQQAEKLSHLKRLVSACHERGIHVIMDGVFSHVSPDFPYRFLYRDPDLCPFVGGFGGSLPGLLELNFDHACTQEFVRDVCLYWIDEFGLDGIRFDDTMNARAPRDSRGLPNLLSDLHAELDKRGERNFSLILERLSVDAASLTNRTPATSFWDDSLRQISNDYLGKGRIDPGLLNALNNRKYLNDPEKIPTLYLGHHEQSPAGFQAGNGSSPGELAGYRTQPLAIALFTGTATPLLQNGAGTSLPELYRRLSEIRRDYPGLRSRGMYPDLWETWQTQLNAFGVGLDTERQLAIYHRWGEGAHGETQTFVVVLNFSEREQWASVPFPYDGRWIDLLSDDAGSWRPEVSGGRLEFSVGPHWGHVFFKE
jgi:glycosidase